jgi:hypothetical protein
MVFVGATRATKWVFMSTVRGQSLLNIDEIRALEKEGTLAIQMKPDLFEASWRTPTFVSEKPPCDDEGIGDLL